MGKFASTLQKALLLSSCFLVANGAVASPTHLGVAIGGYFTAQVKLNGKYTVALVLNPSQPVSQLDPALISAGNLKAEVTLGAASLGKFKPGSTGIKKGSIDDQNVKVVGILGMDVIGKYDLFLDLQNELISLGGTTPDSISPSGTSFERSFRLSTSGQPIVSGKFGGESATYIMDWVDTGAPLAGTVTSAVNLPNPVGKSAKTTCQFGMDLGMLLPPAMMNLKLGSETTIHMPLDQIEANGIEFDFLNKKAKFIFAKPLPLFTQWLSGALPFGLTGPNEPPPSGSLGIKAQAGTVGDAKLPAQFKLMLANNEILALQYEPITNLWKWWNSGNVADYKKLCDFATDAIYTTQNARVTISIDTPFGVEEPTLFFTGSNDN